MRCFHYPSTGDGARSEQQQNDVRWGARRNPITIHLFHHISGLLRPASYYARTGCSYKKGRRVTPLPARRTPVDFCSRENKLWRSSERKCTEGRRARNPLGLESRSTKLTVKYQPGFVKPYSRRRESSYSTFSTRADK